MICDECGKNSATVHLTKIVNGQKNEVHLCEECAKKNKDFDFESPFSIHHFLSGLLDNVQDEPMKVNYNTIEKCENCDMSYSEFKQSGRFGCSECYKQFNNRLGPLFKQIHGHEKHTGKVPKRAGGEIRIRKEIENLKKKLDMAVKKEEFEKAAELRDKIKELESEVK
ncbi:MAG: hypothetical protein FH753_07920 [Firmicutes bacterium]|nr:hypothetical protein [Bacillota bacterium]